MEVIKSKITQGQNKTRHRLKELFDNEVFRTEFKAIQSIPNIDKREKKLRKFAEKYLLEYKPGAPFFDLAVAKIEPKFDKFYGVELDVCQLFDEEDEYLNEQFPMDFDYPPSRNPTKRAQIKAFPIHLGISPYATKRDVLDFIAKRWEHIRYMLDDYLEKPKIIKKKRKYERDAIIWKNRNLSASVIADLINNKYPDENITYADIHKILYYLRRRKLSPQV